MIAVFVHEGIVLAGVAVPEHRLLEVVDEIHDDAGETRRVLTVGEARALVQAGHADAVEANFEHLPALLRRWQRA